MLRDDGLQCWDWIGQDIGHYCTSLEVRSRVRDLLHISYVGRTISFVCQIDWSSLMVNFRLDHPFHRLRGTGVCTDLV